ncbi:hypothetical protein SAMN05216480_11291 [Pustulibacterium marinum]|uniref:Uncharacterized protein n=1 Tax=Pustulibacterium marinum TaxID=1224947 RepID=A0A1I7I2A3_9FLAO|nr:hypothetical protein [Pustulibacterium marinum]SFU67054.1 hypothetical protein SAMN05216480_11291 [Pustulibacterium marinum]
MSFTTIIQKRTFIILVLVQLIFTFIGGIENVGINKTVGWAWDIANFLVLLRVGDWLVILIGYGIIAIAGYRTSLYLSLLQIFLLIAILSLPGIFFLGNFAVFGLHIAALAVFIGNMLWAVRYRKF